MFEYIKTGKTKTEHAELPFDLNQLCNLSFTFDTLKQAIQYLADQQGH